MYNNHPMVHQVLLRLNSQICALRQSSNISWLDFHGNISVWLNKNAVVTSYSIIIGVGPSLSVTRSIIITQVSVTLVSMELVITYRQVTTSLFYFLVNNGKLLYYKLLFWYIWNKLNFFSLFF